MEHSNHLKSKLETNDNSNPQQGADITMNHAFHPGSQTRAMKIPPTAKDDRKLFVGGLPSDGKPDISILIV